MFERLLLIEDDPSHAMLIKRALREVAFNICHVENVKDALKALPEFKPDLIITDLRLPDSSGVSHIELFVKTTPDTPLIVLTSSTAIEDAVQALKIGAKDFIVKNFTPEFSGIFSLSLSRIYAATLQEKERKKILKDLGTLQVAIENSNDGLAVVASDGQISYSNTSFRGFLSKCGSCEYNVHSIFSPEVDKYEFVQASFNEKFRALEAGGVWNTEISFSKDKTLCFELSLSVIGVGEGENTKREYVLWVRDKSEQKRKERFQRELLSTTTHDLKGPLGAITVSVDLLESLLEKESKAMQISMRIGSAAQGAINLIDEFLSARRIEEGSLILRPSFQDVTLIVYQVIENYTQIAVAKGIKLIDKTPPGPVKAKVDTMGLSRIAGNLISNALKFTSTGGEVSVEVSCLGEEIRLVIKDTGTGMEPSEVQRLFQRFSRLERHKDIVGTGLGLFVVKSLVNAHGGRIAVTSQVGRGTTFEIMLPVSPIVDEKGELLALNIE